MRLDKLFWSFIISCGVLTQMAHATIIPTEFLNNDNYSDDYKQQVILSVATHALEYPNVPSNAVWSVIKYESTFGHYDFKGRVKCNRCHAVGICQVIPSTQGIKSQFDVWLLDENIECCYAILDQNLKDYTHGDLELAFGAYNTGRACRNGYARRVYRYFQRLEAAEETLIPDSYNVLDDSLVLGDTTLVTPLE